PEASDWDLWLRLCLVSDVGHLAAPLFGWRRHDGTMTAQMLKSGKSQLESLEVVRKALSLAPQHAPHIARLRGRVLGNAFLKLAAYEYLAADAEVGPSRERAGHARRARGYLAQALRSHPGLVAKSVNVKLGICVLLGPTWGGRAARLKRIVPT